MKVTVTAENIDNGTRRSACSCPIALAIRDQLSKPEAAVEVLSPWVFIDADLYKNTAYDQAYLPHAAMTFITRFDSYLPVEPIEFELEWREVEP